MDWVWEDELLEAGIRAGLEAVGAPPESAAAVTARYRAEAKLTDWEVPEENEYESLERLGVAADRSLFVGDRLYADVRGARGVGMRTVQAMWFRAEEDEDGTQPDFRAFTQIDVLNIVRRLRGEA